MSKKGYFTFVLHSHLPYVVGHGTWPHGTDWLYEASCETYLPLLNVLNRLVEEGISPQITLGLTPILLEQLASPEFKEGLKGYIQAKLDIALENQKTFSSAGERQFAGLASFWYDYYQAKLKDFKESYQEDLTLAFKKLQSEGHIEIMTSCATHGYLPLLGEDISVEAQIKQGISTYLKHFGQEPKGIWLPECAYRPGYEWASPLGKRKKIKRKGVDYFLAKNGLKYFIIDTPMLKGGKTIGVYLERFRALEQLWKQFKKGYRPQPESKEKTPYEVYYLKGAGEGKEVAVFTRDPITALQVWSGEHGYPGDGWYLDFHKKYFPGGLRYWRVTSSKSDLGSKLLYQPEKARERIRENANHFVNLVHNSLKNYFSKTHLPGIVTAPYDAELFGHWWFEGPEFLYLALKGISQDPEIELTTCSRYLSKRRPQTIIELPEGSWGEGGFHWIWFNQLTKWVWKYIYQAEKEMKEIVYKSRSFSHHLKERLLKQMARELLLLESSDWPFLISTLSARDYAEIRASRHYEDFQRIYKMIKGLLKGRPVSKSELSFLIECEKRDNIFEEIDPDWWRENNA
ncbi:DUF1957 domain-containing protein [bacterium]|nr:DUF1957 domain-containing protein [bacterium]